MSKLEIVLKIRSELGENSHYCMQNYININYCFVLSWSRTDAQYRHDKHNRRSAIRGHRGKVINCALGMLKIELFLF